MKQNTREKDQNLLKINLGDASRIWALIHQELEWNRYEPFYMCPFPGHSLEFLHFSELRYFIISFLLLLTKPIKNVWYREQDRRGARWRAPWRGDQEPWGGDWKEGREQRERGGDRGEPQDSRRMVQEGLVYCQEGQQAALQADCWIWGIFRSSFPFRPWTGVSGSPDLLCLVHWSSSLFF